MGASDGSPIVTASGAPSELRYSVVVPVFNEAVVIGEFCRQAVSKLLTSLELLVCYDKPADTTLPAIDALLPEQKPDRIRHIRNDLEPGVRYAVESGLRSAQAIVVVMMADVSDDFSVVEQLVQRAEAAAAVVCGSRIYARRTAGGGAVAQRAHEPHSRVDVASFHRTADLGRHEQLQGLSQRLFGPDVDR